MKTKVIAPLVSALLLSWFCFSCSQDKKPASKDKEAEEALTEAEPEEPEPDTKLFGIRSGILEYKHAGRQTGTTTLYFDQYGHRSATYADMKEDGEIKKGWVISLEGTQYMYDEGSKEGMKMKNPLMESLTQVKDLEKLTEETYDKMGMKPAGTEKYLGKDCKVFKGDMGKVLVWNGLLMYMEMTFGGVTTRQEATRVDLNTRIKPSVFELPNDVTFTEFSMPGMDGMNP